MSTLLCTSLFLLFQLKKVFRDEMNAYWTILDGKQTAGFSAAADATRVSVLIGIFKFLMTGIAVLKVDDLGRKPLLIAGISGITLSLLLLAAYYKFLGRLPIVAVIALILYVSSYQFTTQINLPEL